MYEAQIDEVIKNGEDISKKQNQKLKKIELGEA